MKKLESKLKELKQSGKWIGLSLYPESGNTLIAKKPINICYVNEGRDGVFYNISESFYDLMVEKYDSRT